MHFGLLKVSDMVRVDEDGNRVGGADMPVNTAGFIIHSAIHKARPDINAACHMHSTYGRAWSTFGKPIEMLNQGMFRPILFSSLLDHSLVFLTTLSPCPSSSRQFRVHRLTSFQTLACSMTTYRSIPVSEVWCLPKKKEHVSPRL